MHAGADRCDPEGKKELLGFQVGKRESAQSWKGSCWSTSRRAASLFRTRSWRLATGRSASWKALEEVSPTTRHQRCTVHKTANVLDKLFKSVQPAGKALTPARDLGGLDRADSPGGDRNVRRRRYRTKYEKAVSCLIVGPRRAANLLRLSSPSTGTICGHRTNRERWSPR